VSALDSTTQQNAALVEQSTAAAASLNTRASLLAEAVAVYRGKAAAPAMASVRAAAPRRAPVDRPQRVAPQRLAA
jgi:hypothetical protein